MKNIVYAMKDLLKNYFNWHGRLSRAGYLWSLAGIMAVNAILCIMKKIVLFSLYASSLYPYYRQASDIMAYGIRIWIIVVFFPILFATMRRYHDSGKAGWKALIYNVLSPVFIMAGLLIGSLVVVAFVFGGGYMITAGADVRMSKLLGFVVLCGFLLLTGTVFGILNIIHIFRQSDPKENKYGRPMPFDPRDEGSENIL